MPNSFNVLQGFIIPVSSYDLESFIHTEQPNLIL